MTQIQTSRRVACPKRKRHQLRTGSWIIRWSYYIRGTDYANYVQVQGILSKDHIHSNAHSYWWWKEEPTVLVKNIECLLHIICDLPNKI